MSEVKRIGVVGGGQMGSGIAQVAAMHDIDAAGADALKRLRLTTDLEDLQLADLIIEAIVESEDVKKSLFAQLDRIANSSAILASNTSSISVTRLATPTSRPCQHFFALYTGVATKEDIDTGMKLVTNHPMGPLELADFIGLDVCLSIMRVLHAGLGDNKYAPCALLVQYVDAGRLGRKRGIGVYEYSKDPRSTKSSSRL
ncbi:putative 3-hydroxybutyryl-CoA dehydrogenase [Glycine soja]|uniref:Putative 3-hydroxybutyryl-CoA dehydrogenase n=1 Tax=Glycine soja TaxID=3848 RepID=A0A445KE12_GLYSO|nr:putative 3-hydroxybutyryl-CoA dehydrogenase [Glycine soja]